MKTKLLEIQKNLEQGKITTEQARSLLLGLFDIIESASDAFDRGFTAGYNAGVKMGINSVCE